MKTTKGRNRLERRCASFSLIEILIVFSLIGIIGAVVGTRIYQGSANMRFQSSIKAVKEHLEIAKKVALVTKNETRVMIVKKETGYVLFLEGDGLPQKLKAKFRVTRPLANVVDVRINDQSEESCAIPFYGYGPQYPDKTVQLLGPYSTEEIDLTNYSTPLEGSDTDNKALYPKYYEKEKKLLSH